MVSTVKQVSDISKPTADDPESASAAQEQAALMSQVSRNVESISDRAERLQELLSAFELNESSSERIKTTV
jgi:methyl-accepting chemotaxis protein